MAQKTKEMALISLLAAVITVAGLLRLPGVIPGTEFQLSAPVAVAIGAVFGFRRYLISGVLSSFVSLALGFQNILNVAVAMTFRVAAGGVMLLLGNTFLVAVLAGPVGTFCARLVLALFTGTNVWVLLLAALPGMAYTAVAVLPLIRLTGYLAKAGGFSEFVIPKRSVLRQIFLKNRGKGEGASWRNTA